MPPGGTLGIYGFGGSAHLAAQVAMAQGAAVHVLTRGEAARELAARARRRLGAATVRPAAGAAGRARSCSPRSASWCPAALRALDRGGTLAIAGIHLTDIPALNYERHLFQERQLRSVTANTRADGEEFLTLAERLRIRSPRRRTGSTRPIRP